MSNQKIKIVAYQLGESILIKNLKAAYTGSVYFSSATEVYIRKGETSFIYVQNYGEVAFSDCDDQTIHDFIEFVKGYVGAPVLSGKEYKEEFCITVHPGQQLLFDYHSMQVPEISPDVIKIVLLNMSQSVVLDYFTEQSQHLLSETGVFTKELEQRGTLSIPKTRLMKFIGKTLNTQNRIIDNLYFLDAPDTVWDIEHLAEINNGMSGLFNLKTRFREVEYTLKIIDNNLRTFAQLVQHRDSNKMEIIIILLIFFEILNAVISKLY